MIRLVAVALLASCLVSSAAAQKKQTSGSNPSLSATFRLVAVKVTGTTRYSDKELLVAGGLQMGQNAGESDFKEAVQRLGDTGLFSEAMYSFTSSSSGIKLELQLTDIEESKLVPAHFENFVYFTDQELMAALGQKVPLFRQLLPVAGSLTDRVSEALQVILDEKRLLGRVDYLRDADQDSGTLTAIDYRIEEIGIHIRNLEFPGASPELAALLARAASRVSGGEYSRAALAAVATHDLLPVYQQRGYLKASFAPSEARVVSQQPAESTAQGPINIEVDAILGVAPGKVYAASGVDWKGTAAVSNSEAATLLHLVPGQPADAVRLGNDLASVSKLYRSRGYMMVAIKPDARFDDDKGTVHYDINVAEGDLYKMGELEILGLDTQAKASLQEAWKLPEGQPYNADYPQKFLDETANLLPRGVQWNITVHATPDTKDKTVDVELRFKAR